MRADCTPEELLMGTCDDFFGLEDFTKLTVKREGFDELDTEIKTAEPKLILNKWDKEVSLEISYPSEKLSTNKPNTIINEEAKKVTQNYGNISFDIYQIDNSSMEYMIILNSKPKGDTIYLDLKGDENFDFYYQHALDSEMNNDSCNATDCQGTHRPENVVGSYAVYHKTNKNNEYKTGKAFHIYRPKIFDANNKSIWGYLHYDKEKHQLRVTIPQEFLDKATYPIKVDPTFGYTSIGATADSISGGMYGSKFSSISSAGTSDKLSVYLKETDGIDGSVDCAQYGDDGSYDKNTGSETIPGSTSAQWWDFEFESTKPTFSNGDDLWFFVGEDGSGEVEVYRDSTGGTSRSNYYLTPWRSDVTDFTGTDTNKWSIYLTYTSSGGGNNAPNATVNAPSNDATGQALSVDLNVTVTDEDGDSMNVSFYNNATDSQISTTQTSIANGSTAEVTWSGLSVGTTYSWYVNVTDGTDTTQSSVWSFTTTQTPVLVLNDTYPDSPSNSDDLKFNITCTDSDAGETITGYLQIYNESATYGSVQSSTVTNNTETTLFTLGSGNTTKNSNWTGEYWCGDGTSNSSKSNDSVQIASNSAPTTPNSITCDGGSCNDSFSGTVSMNCSGSTDEDNDVLTYLLYYGNTTPAFCNGSSNSCGAYNSSETNCTGAGCSYNSSYCDGSPDSCGTHNESQSDCEAVGCDWVSGGGGGSGSNIYYFDDYEWETWDTSPENVVDGDNTTYGQDNDEGYQMLLNSTNYTGGMSDTISSVEFRLYWWSNNWDGTWPQMKPSYDGTNGSVFEDDDQGGGAAWTEWYDITEDTNAPATWTWSDIETLNLYLGMTRPSWGLIRPYIIELRVNYSAGVDYCNGTANACGTFNDTETNCTTAGCSFNDEVCYGTASTCDNYVDQTNCTTYGCDWNAEETSYTYMGNHTNGSTYNWDISGFVGEVFESFKCYVTDGTADSANYTQSSNFTVGAGGDTTTFNITLVGESDVASNGSTTDIEFNSSGASESDVEPCVVGGSCQIDGSSIAIFEFTNTGSVALNWTVCINDSMPGTINIECGGTNNPTSASAVPLCSSSNLTLQSSIATDATVKGYCWSDFSSALASDSTTRQITHGSVDDS